MNPFSQTTFAVTVADLSQLPAPSRAEIAFAGRSNVGKSSAINALAQRRGLAFVARRPGKTRALQFYRLAAERYLVDLPGYGYAQVAATERQRWERLLERYLLERQVLTGMILVMDVRHPFTALDDQLLMWFLPRRLPVHILLNKADKLSHAQALGVQRDVEKTLVDRRMDCGVQLFSSATRQGLAQARATVAQWFGLDAPHGACTDSVRENKNPRLKGSKAGGEMP